MPFRDVSGASIGDPDHEILPLHLERADPAKPAMLKLKLNYAVCEKLCVPVDGKAELAIPATDATQDEAIAASEARVPKPTTIGAAGALAITAIRRQSSPRPRVIVDVMVRDATQADLFAEGPTPDWALPLPERISHGPDGLWRFAFDLDGLPPNASAQGAALTLTAVTPERAIELMVRLD
jgi:DsbC/DsbD-like thiol-disulfide interchange protein